MFNNLRKFLREGVSHNELSLNSCFYLLSLAIVLATSAIKIARADVCFLPSGGCDMVPYEENPNPNYSKDCFATKAEAMSARTSEMDSYYKNGDMWCIKSSCSGYNETSMLPGGWDCQNCNDSQSLNYNKYKCSCDLEGATPRSGYTIDLKRCEEKPNACPSNASTDCVPDECHKCNSISSVNPVYSGGKECLIYSTVEAHCPDWYVPNEPAGGCYSTQDMVCGSGKCYKAVDAPECSGAHKHVSKANGVCSCACDEGYTMNNGECVKDEDKWFVMRFEDNLSSCFTFDNFEGDGVSVLDVGYLKFFIGKSFKINYIHDDEEDLYNRATAKIIANNYDFGSQKEFTINEDFLNKVFPDGVENYQWYMNTNDVGESPTFRVDDQGCEPISVADYYVTVNLVSYIDEPDSPDGVCRKTFIGYNYATGDLNFLKNAEYILQFSDIKYRGGDQAGGMCDSGVSLNGNRLDCSKADYDCDNTYENPYPIITSAQLEVLKFNEEKQIHEVVQTISAMNGWEKCQTVTINSKKVEICLNIDSTDR